MGDEDEDMEDALTPQRTPARGTTRPRSESPHGSRKKAAGLPVPRGEGGAGMRGLHGDLPAGDDAQGAGRAEDGAADAKARGDGDGDGDSSDGDGAGDGSEGEGSERPHKRARLEQHETRETVESLLRCLDCVLSKADAYVNAQTSWVSKDPPDVALPTASAADVEATAHELMGGVAAVRATAALATVIPAGGHVFGGNDVPWWSSKPGAPVGTKVTGSKSERAVSDRTDLELTETVCRVWRESSDDSVGSLYDGEPVALLTEEDVRNGKFY